MRMLIRNNKLLTSLFSLSFLLLILTNNINSKVLPKCDSPYTTYYFSLMMEIGCLQGLFKYNYKDYKIKTGPPWAYYVLNNPTATHDEKFYAWIMTFGLEDAILYKKIEETFKGRFKVIKWSNIKELYYYKEKYLRVCKGDFIFKYYKNKEKGIYKIYKVENVKYAVFSEDGKHYKVRVIEPDKLWEQILRKYHKNFDKIDKYMKYRRKMKPY